MQSDLRDPDAVEALYAAVQSTGRPLSAAALDAGVGHGGAFVENDLADEQTIIDLNTTSTVHLAKLVLRDMVAADEGRLLITSSIASTMPGATDTNFFKRAEMEDTKVGQSNKDDPAQVAEQGFEALMAGKDKILAASLKTKVQGLANKVVPDKLKAETHRQMAEPGSGEQPGVTRLTTPRHTTRCRGARAGTTLVRTGQPHQTRLPAARRSL